MMKNVYGAFLLIFILFCACETGNKKLPISEEKLIDILTDIHYAEAALQDVYGTQKDSLKQVYYQDIYHLHEITEEELTKAMDILRHDPVHLDKIYQEVVDNLKG